VAIKEDPTERSHLVLLAKNINGYRNIRSMLAEAERSHKHRGFPRIDFNLLDKYREDIFVTTSCPSGVVYKLLSSDNMDDAEAFLRSMKECVGGENVFLEIQNLRKFYKSIGRDFVTLSSRAQVPLVGTCDCHMISTDDWDVHRILVSLRFPKGGLSEGYPSETYVQDDKEAFRLFKRLYNSRRAGEAMTNAYEIAEACECPFSESQNFMPQFANSAAEEAAILKERSRESLLRMMPRNRRKRYLRQLKYELSVIKNQGFSGYFLLVDEIMQYARKNGIEFGPGRGSCAGSVVCWSLGITQLDPIKHGLYFERFLNPSRVSYPDIDLDFEHRRRDEIIKHIREKYGTVLPIMTWNMIRGKTALKDVARLMGIPAVEQNEWTKMFPEKCERIEDALEQSGDLRRVAEMEENEEIFRIAQRLQGLKRQTGLHAAAVAVLTKGAADLVPVLNVKTGSGRHATTTECTAFDMHDIEALGVLKVDILGLATLSVIKDVRSWMEMDFDWNTFTSDSDAVQIIRQGKTAGIFQMEGIGITKFIRRLKPEKFEDAVLAVSAYRPGPMDFIDRMLEVRQGKSEPGYIHECLEPIFGPTYGWPVYQEQVMALMRALAGMSMAEADLVRKAMGKKLPEEMAKIRKTFVRGAIKKSGLTRDEAHEIFDWVQKFAGYAFNKAHGASYALISMATAALKSRHPEAFYAALLNAEGFKKGILYAGEAALFGVRFLPPDINKSQIFCTPEKNVIRFGLGLVKNIGEAAEQIIRVRQNHGPFGDIEKFIDLCPFVDKRTIESLILAGAFDSIHGNRQAILAVVERSWKKRKRRQLRRGAVHMLAELPDMRPCDYPADVEENLVDRCLAEMSLIGFSPSARLLRKRIPARIIPAWKLRAKSGKHAASIFAVVDQVEFRMNRDRLFGYIRFNDLTASMTGTCGYQSAERLQQMGTEMKSTLLIAHGTFYPPDFMKVEYFERVDKKGLSL
jgi:DNA polymerase-3 subunit alpha